MVVRAIRFKEIYGYSEARAFIQAVQQVNREVAAKL
jgi:hypothetical protein